MINLIGNELRRMWNRRMPWTLLLSGAALILLNGVIVFVTHESDVPDTSDSEGIVEAQLAECRDVAIEEWNRWDRGGMTEVDAGYRDYLASFETAAQMADDRCDPQFFAGLDVGDPRFCLVSLYEPTVLFRQGCPDAAGAEALEYEVGAFRIEAKLYRTLQPPPNGIVPDAGVFLLLVAAILGASFIGAEYSSGMIETTVLWQPRRRRLLVSKVAAAALTALLLHWALLTLLVLAMLPAATFRGSMAGVDGDFWLGVLGVVTRGGLAAAAIASIALSISVVTRNTAGGFALLVGYAAVSPLLSTSLLKDLRPLDLTENLAAFASGGEVGRFIDIGNVPEAVYAHGVTTAAITVGFYVAVALTVALIVFHRRDID